MTSSASGAAVAAVPLGEAVRMEVLSPVFVGELEGILRAQGTG